MYARVASKGQETLHVSCARSSTETYRLSYG